MAIDHKRDLRPIQFLFGCPTHGAARFGANVGAGRRSSHKLLSGDFLCGRNWAHGVSVTRCRRQNNKVANSARGMALHRSCSSLVVVQDHGALSPKRRPSGGRPRPRDAAAWRSDYQPGRDLASGEARQSAPSRLATLTREAGGHLRLGERDMVDVDDGVGHGGGHRWNARARPAGAGKVGHRVACERAGASALLGVERKAFESPLENGVERRHALGARAWPFRVRRGDGFARVRRWRAPFARPAHGGLDGGEARDKAV